MKAKRVAPGTIELAAPMMALLVPPLVEVLPAIIAANDAVLESTLLLPAMFVLFDWANAGVAQRAIIAIAEICAGSKSEVRRLMTVIQQRLAARCKSALAEVQPLFLSVWSRAR
jgi:hypothetical protein